MSICRGILIILVLFTLCHPNLSGQKSHLNKSSLTSPSANEISDPEKYLKEISLQKDTAKIIEAVFQITEQYIHQAQFAKAEKLMETCLTYPYTKKNKSISCKLQIKLGILYRLDGEYSKALLYYQKAKKISETISDSELLTECNVQLAEYYRKLSKHPIALEYINEALQTYEEKKLKDTVLLISIHNRAAAIHNEFTPDPQVTIHFSRKALQLAQESKNLNAEAISLNELGFTYKNLRKVDSSEILYQKAENLWLSLGKYPEAMHALNNRIMLYMHNDYPQDTIFRMYQNMVEFVKKNEVDYSLNEPYGYLSKYYISKGDSAAAYRYFYKYHESIIHDITRKNDQAIANLTEKYQNEKSKKEIKRLYDELNDSQTKLEATSVANQRMYYFIATLLALMSIIIYLLIRINRSHSALKERNKEKDALIQEIHHRVKNNLQFISSLMNMQINSSTNEVEIYTLNDASRRIKAMALVHEMLYTQKEAGGISMKPYMEELISSLNDAVNSDKIPIRFKLDIAEVDFNVSDSIALGMITSELVSNSMKHAFGQVTDPEIRITLSVHKNEVMFTVRDNGPGLQKEDENKKTMGLRLIDIFSRQLKAKYHLQNENGCKFEIKFSIK